LYQLVLVELDEKVENKMGDDEEDIFL